MTTYVLCMILSQISVGYVAQNIQYMIDVVYLTTQFVSAGSYRQTDECKISTMEKEKTFL